MLSRYLIRPRSPLVTPLMSDTLFGHFCWALVYTRGETFLTEFLGSYAEDSPAPVLFSNAFPEGTLPRPALAPLARYRLRELVKDRFGNDKERIFRGYLEVKKLGKLKYLPVNLWQRLKDGFSEGLLINTLLQQGRSEEPILIWTETTTSNIINRESGSVPNEGGLFQREKLWYNPYAKLDLYVETQNDEYGSLVQWFLTEYLPGYGYGADKTVGMGRLEILLDSSFDPSCLAAANPNARLSLSLAAFRGMERFPSSYQLETKFGRLGGDFAFSSPTGGPAKPFKKPVLMFEPGAVFFTTENFNNRCLLTKVHSDNRIRHCGIPITLAFRISEDEIDESIPA